MLSSWSWVEALVPEYRPDYLGNEPCPAYEGGGERGLREHMEVRWGWMVEFIVVLSSGIEGHLVSFWGASRDTRVVAIRLRPHMRPRAHAGFAECHGAVN